MEEIQSGNVTKVTEKRYIYVNDVLLNQWVRRYLHIYPVGEYLIDINIASKYVTFKVWKVGK